MSGRVSFEQFSDSQCAIREYIHFDESHWGTHKGIVKVIQNGDIIFDDELSIVALIDTNESFISIIWTKEWEGTYYVKYSNWYQIFKYHNDILEIKCQNKKGKEIKIHIK